MKRALAVWLLLGAAAGCGGDDDGGLGHTIPCAVADESCRKAIFTLTARVRKQKHARMPPSRIITRDQYASELRAEYAMQMSTPENMQYEEAMRLLQFLPAGGSMDEAVIDSNVQGVVAYYRNDTKDVTIIADYAEDPENGSETLSHEYTHALQDQREDLQEVQAGPFSTDEFMSVQSLIEGEAVVISDAAMQEAAGQDYDLAATTAYLNRFLNGLLTQITMSDAPFNEAQLVIEYPVGGAVLSKIYAMSGAPGIAAQYVTRPDTLLQWIDRTRTEVPTVLRCNFPDGPAGYKRIGLDRWGYTGVLALEVIAGSNAAASYTNAQQWSADSAAVYAPTDGSTQAAVAWRIGFKTADAASSLATRLRTQNVAFTVEQQGTELLLTAASSPAVFAGWTTRSGCSTEKSLVEPQMLFKQLPMLFKRFARN